MGEQLGQQVSHPPRHLVHVVVQVGLGIEDRPALGPLRHPRARRPHVPDQHIAGFRGQSVQPGKHDAGIAGHERVRGIFTGRSEPVDQLPAILPAAENPCPALQQRDLLSVVDLLVVFQVVGHAQEQIGDGDFLPERLGQCLDSHGERAAGSDQQVAEVSASWRSGCSWACPRGLWL